MKLNKDQIQHIAAGLEEGMNAYVNTETAEVKFIIDFDTTFGDDKTWKDELKIIEASWESYLIIVHPGKREQLRMMKEFSAQVDQSEIRIQLIHALSSGSPMEAYRAVLEDHDALEREWAIFKNEELEEYVRQKVHLEEEDIALGGQANSSEVEQGSSTADKNNESKDKNPKGQLSVSLLAKVNLHTRYGEWEEQLFYDGQQEIIALIMGDLEHAEEVYCRLHSSCIHGHYFNSIECTCQAEMSKSQEIIQQAGRGVIILLDQEGKGNGHLALLNSIHYKRQGMKQADAYAAAGFEPDARNYRAAAQVIQALGVRSVVLLTESSKKITAMWEHGITIIKNIPIKLD